MRTSALTRAKAWLVRDGVLLLAIALACAAAATATSYPSGPRAPAVILSALTGGAVALRRTSTLAMTLCVAAGLALLAAIGIGVTPMWAFVELLLVAFWAAEGLSPRRCASAGGLLLIAAIAFDARSGENDAAASVISPLVIVGVPALGGLLLRRSRQQAAQLRRLTAELAAERDRAAAAAELAERARIAREIHDVVAHTVSVMLVQAGAAADQLDPAHPANTPVAAIRSTGKQALAELRRVIGVLRAAQPEDTHPQPTLADLPDLIGAARAGSETVHLDCDIDPDDLPPGVQLTVYRTIQEALTNVRKHSPGAATVVSLHRDATTLHVLVENDGGERTAGSVPGYGLVGLRERADLYDATLTSGPTDDGRGWRVELHVPILAAQRQEHVS